MKEVIPQLDCMFSCLAGCCAHDKHVVCIHPNWFAEIKMWTVRGIPLAVNRERPGGRGFRLVIKPSPNGYVNKWNGDLCKKMITYQLRICYLHGLVVIWRMPANRGQTVFRITFIQNDSLMNYITLPEPANFWRNNPCYYNWTSCLERGEMSESTNITIINQIIIMLSLEWIWSNAGNVRLFNLLAAG